MNARSVAALSFVLALGAVAGLWVWLRAPEAGPKAARVEALAPDAGSGAKAGAARADSKGFAVGEAEAAEVEARSETSHRTASVKKESAATDVSNAIWLDGRVVFRDGTPPDEAIRVEARGKRFHSGPEGRSYFGDAARDGRFRVAFAEGTRTGWIEIEARYSYLDEKRKVDVGDERELVLEPKLGGRVEGRALAPASLTEEPNFEDSSAALVSWGGPDYFRRTAKLDAEGRFAFGGIPPGSDYRVQIESKRYCDRTTEPIAVRPGETTAVQIELERGALVSGRVVGPDGEGVANAHLSLTTTRTGATDHESLQSEPDGSFELAGVKPGKGTLEVSHEDYLDASEELGELAAGGARTGLVVRMGRGNVLDGVVTWPDGTPAEGAWVQVEQEGQSNGWAMFGQSPNAKCDAEGRFRFSGLADAPCKLRAVARPKTDPSDEGEGDEAKPAKRGASRRRGAPFVARRENVQPNARGISLVLGEGDAVRGRVVDDAGKPVTRFRVSAQPSENQFGNQVSALVMDEGGAFQLTGLFEGDWRVSAQSRGYADAKAESISVPYEGGELLLRMPRQATLRGRVLAPNGEPIAGARVQIGDPDGGRMWFGGSPRGERTDDQGEFEDERVEPGKRRLIASADGYGESEPLDVDVPAAGEVTGIALVLRRSGRIVCSLHPAVGELAGRSVNVTRQQGSYYRQSTTDSNGRFELDDLSPGTYRLYLQPSKQVVDAEGNTDWMLQRAQSSEATVELAEGATANVVLGSPPVRAIEVSGKLTQAGRPVADRTITWDAPGRAGRDGARTAADGSYSVTLDGPGAWTVSIGSSWSERYSMRVEVPDVDRHHLDIELPTGSIAGRVVSRGGEPLANCPVSIVGAPPEGTKDPNWRDTRSTHTDDEGAYRFDELRAGVYDLTAGGGEQWGQGSTFGRRTVRGMALGEGERKQAATLELEAGGVIEGAVVDGSGQPVDGAWVQVLDGSSSEDTPWSAAYAQGGGHFRCTGVAPGSVRVRAMRGKAVGAWREVRVDSGATARIDLVVDG